MATIAYLSSGDFSTATPKKVVASQVDGTTNTSYYTNIKSGSPAYVPFTPSATGNIAGAFLTFFLGISDASGAINTTTISVTLQQNTGSWVDTSSAKTFTLTELLVGQTFGYCESSGMTWTYFDFATTTALTTDASTWRLKVETNSTSAVVYLQYVTSGNYNYAIVTTDDATYTSGDDCLIRNNITMTIDQDMTFGVLAVGTHGTIKWTASPAASYTFTATKMWISRGTEISIGTSANPIPYAQQAVWSAPFYLKVNYQGAQSNLIRFYGEKTTLVKSKLDGDVASGQKVITLADDCSTVWQAGDTVRVYGSKSKSSPYETKTIDTVVGKVITFTTNLSYSYESGYYAINFTRARMLGIRTTLALNPQVCIAFKLSGVLLEGSFACQQYGGNADAIAEPALIDTVHMYHGSYLSLSYGQYARAETIITDYTVENTSDYAAYITVSPFRTTTITRVVGFGIGTYNNLKTATFNDCQFINSPTQSGYVPFNVTNMIDVVFNGCRFWGGSYSINAATAVGIEFDSCYFDAATYSAFYTSGVGVGINFNDCLFGSVVMNTADIRVGTAYAQIKCNNCIGVTCYDDNLASALAGSYVTSHTNNQTANSHVAYLLNGKTQSTGDGLTDTTVHTSGTGKFAIRFEPKSSTDNLEWEFDIPTGDIQNKTMTVGVWCKINSATYYAGTHQLPRLAIDYDNGTTAYCQAGESTDWQLLFVTFTPTTTYGQITVTLSGRTDATTTDAYIYFDDFTVAYPPSVALDLGGLDNWANALPVTPPIALPISAGTVAQGVWTQLKATDYGTGTMGTYVKNQLELNDVILGK